MGVVYDKHCATSTPSITFEVNRIDFKWLLGVNETSWGGCGGSGSPDLIDSSESCSRVPAGSPGGGGGVPGGVTSRKRYSETRIRSPFAHSVCR